MTLQQLEYIVALNNFRHFVKAAEHCYITQPTLTQQLKKLEDEIGVKLFDRNSKPLKPTRAGEQILIKAHQIIRDVEQLKAFVSNETESLVGEFTLGIIPTVSPYLLPGFLPGFMDKNPDTRLKISELQTEQIVQKLKNGTLDMGILSTPIHDNQIRAISMYNEPFLLYLPDNHEWSKKQNIPQEWLDAEQMLVLEEGHCFRDQALEICSSSRRFYNRLFEYNSGSIQALKGLVKRGIGYTLVPELSVLEELDSPNIRRLQEPEPMREISIVTHTSFSKEALIERLHAAVLSAIPGRFKTFRLSARVKWH